MDDLGVCIRHGAAQIAVFKLSGNEWSATQNSCPHDNKMVLSRGLTGDSNGEPKITCPLHKRSFSLRDGRPISDDSMPCLTTYPVKVESSKVMIEVPV